MELEQVLPLRVDLGVMVMKRRLHTPETFRNELDFGIK